MILMPKRIKTLLAKRERKKIEKRLIRAGKKKERFEREKAVWVPEMVCRKLAGHTRRLQKAKKKFIDYRDRVNALDKEMKTHNKQIRFLDRKISALEGFKDLAEKKKALERQINETASETASLERQLQAEKAERHKAKQSLSRVAKSHTRIVSRRKRLLAEAKQTRSAIDKHKKELASLQKTFEELEQEKSLLQESVESMPAGIETLRSERNAKLKELTELTTKLSNISSAVNKKDIAVNSALQKVRELDGEARKLDATARRVETVLERLRAGYEGLNVFTELENKLYEARARLTTATDQLNVLFQRGHEWHNSYLQGENKDTSAAPENIEAFVKAIADKHFGAEERKLIFNELWPKMLRKLQSNAKSLRARRTADAAIYLLQIIEHMPEQAKHNKNTLRRFFEMIERKHKRICRNLKPEGKETFDYVMKDLSAFFS